MSIRNGQEPKWGNKLKKNIAFSLLLSTLIFLINGCTNLNANKNESNINSEDGQIKSISVDWDLSLSIKDISVEDVIVDEKLALEIGNAVFKSIYGEDIISQTKFQIYNLEQNDVFVISRFHRGEMLGGDYNVAISKKDGAILKFWIGE